MQKEDRLDIYSYTGYFAFSLIIICFIILPYVFHFHTNINDYAAFGIIIIVAAIGLTITGFMWYRMTHILKSKRKD